MEKVPESAVRATVERCQSVMVLTAWAETVNPRVETVNPRSETVNPKASSGHVPVSYTHLTLPTNREV